MSLRRILSVVVASMLVAGCSAGKTTNKQDVTPTSVTNQIGKNSFIYANGSLKEMNLVSGSVISSTSLPDELAPISFMFNKTFKVNADGSYVVWFVPGKGLVRWHSKDKSVAAFYEPTEWFHENPYFQFAGDTNTIVLIDKKGSEVVWYDLNTNKTITYPVPYPFGTIFVISPDVQKMVYVEGYRQTTGSPAYLVSTVNGDPIIQFKTKTEIGNRFFIAWTPDSAALIAVEHDNQLVRYTLDNFNTGYTVVQLPDGEKITGFEPHRHWLFLTTQTSWYLVDLKDYTILKRLPVDIAAPLNKPRLVPVDDNQFFIEEDVRSFEQTYKRLWLSDWMGVRKMLVPEYGRRVTDTNAY